MENSPNSQVICFDTELSVNAATFDGTAKLIGTLSNNPVMILFKNQTTVSVFLADNTGATKGTTMAESEEIIIDCDANRALAAHRSWPVGTSFYATGVAGTGSFKISVIYAK